MRNATFSDKSQVVKILTESFHSNPHLNYIIKSGKRKRRRLAILAEYIFYIGFRRNSIYLSDNEQGAAIVIQKELLRFTFYEYWLQLLLIFRVFGLSRVYSIYKLESLIKKTRPQNLDYLYFWFFGVSKLGKGTNAARELKESIFNQSRKMHLPIFMETSVERNKKIYHRYGAKSYKKLTTKIQDLTIWFMYRLPA